MVTMPSHPRVVKFGVFEVDLQAGEVRKAGMKQKLAGQPFQVLQALLERPQEIVTREELRQRLWPGNTFVDYELALKKAVNRLREVLGDSADSPHFIETIPRRGYRFLGTLDAAEPPNAISAATTPRSTRMKIAVAVTAGSALVLIAALFAFGGFRERVWNLLSFRPVHALNETDYILLGDFVNRTGDPVFDGTLTNALAVKLGESPFLNFVSDQRVRETMRYMGLSTSEQITARSGREICQRLGLKAMITGEIVALGHQYVLTLDAVNCRTGDPLALVVSEAGKKEEVLRTLGTAASQVRSKLGESLTSIQRFDAPLEQATTSSLDALKAYSTGMTIIHQRGDLAAIPFFQHAVELDPNFAIAYSALGGLYGDISKPELGDDYSRKAFELRDRTSEREKFLVSADYYSSIGQLEKAAQIGELWAQTYPNDSKPHGFLSSNYEWLGQFDKVLPHVAFHLQKEPNNLHSLEILLGTYMALNRFEDAENVANKLGLLTPELPYNCIYRLGFVRGDRSEMQRQLALARAAKEDFQMLGYATADTTAYGGRIEKQSAIPMTTSDAEPAAISQLKRALWEVEFQLKDAARRDARAALANAPTRYVRIMAALALARAGDASAAEKLATELEKAYPSDSMMRLYWVSSIRASLELGRNDPVQAINQLRAATSVELSTNYLFFGATMYPAYLRGLTYLVLRQGSEAAAEFQKIIDHRGLIANCPLGALARLGLARAHALKGDRATAKAAYQDFLTLWKDADPDIPILKQANVEFAKLQ
jgi:DNA-binding winged helix-turn-helix (wHTH) protein/tetratricopeptide (TPR) repeat protein